MPLNLRITVNMCKMSKFRERERKKKEEKEKLLQVAPQVPDKRNKCYCPCYE